jgi:glycerol-3-phosphate dehydrogenase (NAD(P)+)
MKLTVIGAGSWGTAIAVHLAKANPLAEIHLCPRTELQLQEIQVQGQNQAYLPGIVLPPTIRLTVDWRALFQETLERDHLLVLATPFAHLQTIAQAVIKHGFFPKSWIWLCKGIDPQNGKLAHELMAEAFQQGDRHSALIQSGVLSGPSFAIEVAKGLPCALTIATQADELAQLVQSTMHYGNMRIYQTNDLIGVELGGAIKNILAIAAGIIEQLQLGQNARAALITRGMAEMTRLGLAMGARAETFSGLTGLGDLILTATGDLSRNKLVGIELAKGHALEMILQNLGHVAEGVRCAHAVRKLAQQLGVEMPIVEMVCGVLDRHIHPRDAVLQLMARDPKHEIH